MRLFLFALALTILAGCQTKAEEVTTLAIGGSAAALARFQQTLDTYRQSHRNVVLKTQTWNSNTALQKLRDGSLDIAMVSQPLSETTDLDVTPLGEEPIAILVHPTNKVDNLTSNQMRQIFSGRIQDWSAVGGSPGTIQVASREEGSGTRAVFLSQVVGSSSLARTARVWSSPAGTIDYVSGTPNAIGYVDLSMVPTDKVKTVKLDDLAATSARYRLMQPFFAASKAEPTGAKAELVSVLAEAAGEASVHSP